MTLFNSQNPRIAAAQAQVLETLSSIPDEYGAVFVIDEYQDELRLAVRAHTQRKAAEAVAVRLNRPGRRGRRKAAVVDLAGRRVA